MQNISEDMVRAAFARQVQPMTVLLRITAEGLADDILVSSDPDGTISRGLLYEHFPFEFSGGGASNEDQSRSARLEIGNTDGRIGEAVRALTGSPVITIETVRAAAPDVVELAIEDAELEDIEIDDPKITATVKARRFDTEPACKARYTIARTPGLF